MTHIYEDNPDGNMNPNGSYTAFQLCYAMYLHSGDVPSFRAAQSVTVPEAVYADIVARHRNWFYALPTASRDRVIGSVVRGIVEDEEPADIMIE